MTLPQVQRDADREHDDQREHELREHEVRHRRHRTSTAIRVATNAGIKRQNVTAAKLCHDAASPAFHSTIICSSDGAMAASTASTVRDGAGRSQPA